MTAVSMNFKKIFDVLPQGITIQDSTGKMIYANPEAVKMIGFSSERELLKTPTEEVLKKFVVMDEKRKVLPSDKLPGRRMLKDKKPKELTVRFRSASGKKEYWSHITSVSFEDPKNHFVGVLNTFYDVTQSKKREIALAFFNEMGKSLTASMNYEVRLKRLGECIVSGLVDGCFIDLFDNEGRLQHAVIAHRDPKKKESLQELLDKYFSGKTHQEKIQELIEKGKAKTYQSLTVHNFAKKMLSKRDRELLEKLEIESVSMIPLNVRGKNLGAITFVCSDPFQPYGLLDKKNMEEFIYRSALLLDNARLFGVARRIINQQKEIQNILQDHEIKLRFSERKFKSIFETSLDAIVIADDEMRIMEANAAATELFDTPKRGLLNKKITEFASDESKKKIAKRWKKFQKIGWQRGEIEIIGEQEQILTVEYSAKKEPIPHQNLFIFRDVSARIEEENRREHLLSIASHELRTPLASIRVFVEILKRPETHGEEEQKNQYLSKIDEKTETLSRLIDDLLDLARIRENKLELFYEMANFEEFLAEVLSDTQLTLPTHKIYREGKLERNVVFDKNRLAQVVINLIKNAVKYSPAANKVIVKISEKKDYLQLSVQDYGIGIPRTEQKKIFDIFYRVNSPSKKRVEGLGVGLFISSEIIKKHGGKIWVRSHKGKGSTFFVTIPFQPKVLTTEAQRIQEKRKEDL